MCALYVCKFKKYICRYIYSGEIIVKFCSYYTNGKGAKKLDGFIALSQFSGAPIWGIMGISTKFYLPKLPQEMPHTRRKQVAGF